MGLVGRWRGQAGRRRERVGNMGGPGAAQTRRGALAAQAPAPATHCALPAHRAGSRSGSGGAPMVSARHHSTSSWYRSTQSSCGQWRLVAAAARWRPSEEGGDERGVPPRGTRSPP